MRRLLLFFLVLPALSHGQGISGYYSNFAEAVQAFRQMPDGAVELHCGVGRRQVRVLATLVSHFPGTAYNNWKDRSLTLNSDLGFVVSLAKNLLPSERELFDAPQNFKLEPAESNAEMLVAVAKKRNLEVIVSLRRDGDHKPALEITVNRLTFNLGFFKTGATGGTFLCKFVPPDQRIIRSDASAGLR